MTDDAGAGADGVDVSVADQELVAALIHVLSDGDGQDALGRAEWARLAGAICVETGLDRDDVVIIASDDGAQLRPKESVLESQEAIAAASSLSTGYLRDVAGLSVDEIAAMDDLERVQTMLEHVNGTDIDGGDR